MRQKALQVLAQMQKLIVGQPTPEAVLLGLISGQHVLFVGPPGVAKTYTVKVLQKLVRGKYYFAQLYPTTTFDDLFGPLDPRALLENRLERLWTDIVRADVVFIDEIDKGERVLPALLTFMQERAVDDKRTGRLLKAELHTLIGATNSVSREQKLLPFFDRFAVVAHLKQIGEEDVVREAVVRKWLSRDDIQPVADISDFKKLREQSVQLLTQKVMNGQTLTDLYCRHVLPYLVFLSNHGVFVSNRKMVEQAPLVYSAYVTLYGLNADNVLNAVFDLLPYLLLHESDVYRAHGLLKQELGALYYAQLLYEEAKLNLIMGNRAEAQRLLSKAEQKLLTAEAETELQKERKDALEQSIEWLRQKIRI